MKEWLAAYIKDNLNDLLALDIKWARILGAPQGYTLSGYSYELEQKGRLWGKLWRPIIDVIFHWIFNQTEHCRYEHYKDLERQKNA